MTARKTDAGLYAVTVQGEAYEFQKWGAIKALDMMLDITGVAGQPLGVAMTDGNGIETAVTGNFVAKLMASLTGNMAAHKAMVMDIFKRLSADGVFCGGKLVDFDTHYADRLPHMVMVSRAALEVQYGSFTAAVRAALAEAQGSEAPALS